MPFLLPTERWSNLILFDVWHHLEYPGSAMAEFARVLAPKGSRDPLRARRP